MKCMKMTAALLLAAMLLTACGDVPEPTQNSTAAPVSSASPESSEITADASIPEDESAEPEDVYIPGEPVLPNESEFPDLLSFTAQTLDGGGFGSVDLTKADVIVMNCWGTFCGPCIQEMPEIAAFEQSLPENVRLVTFCVDVTDDSGRSTARSILDSAGYTGTTLIYPSGDLETLKNQMMYVPTTIFLDSDGHILGDVIVGSVDIAEVYSERINEILAAMSPVPGQASCFED